MNKFYPHRNMVLQIEQSHYSFIPYQYFPKNQYFPNEDDVFAIEGAEAIIYQVQDQANSRIKALKVIKPSYRDEHIARSTEATIYLHKKIPGLAVGDRICITRKKYPKLINDFPGLEYAILMPWISGRTWAGFMLDRIESARYTASQALSLALATAHTLWNLENHHLTHSDIAGCNVVISQDLKRIELLDIENLFKHGTSLPKQRSHGSPGYQHRNLDQRGQCRPEGDRFAGAILLTEMLTWANPVVRTRTPNTAETLFQPQELQVSTPRLHMLRNALYTMYPAVLPLFDQAWTSSDLVQCPDFSTWTLSLMQTSKR